MSTPEVGNIATSASEAISPTMVNIPGRLVSTFLINIIYNGDIEPICCRNWREQSLFGALNAQIPFVIMQ